MIRRCTSTKSIDGGSCSERVPCDGVIEVHYHGGVSVSGGCGEPCDFLMDEHRRLQEQVSILAGPVEEAFRAGYRVGYEDAAGPPGNDGGELGAWEHFNNGEKR